MADPLDEVEAAIEDLVSEERRLWKAESDGVATDAERERLRTLRVSLDRHWDLLRRRRAAVESGSDPADMRLRSEQTVENYLQ